MKPARHAIPIILVLLLSGAVHAREIGFIEDFSLATDREKALEQLVPGTDDYYYYHCLHYQNTDRREEFQRLLKQWVDRRGRETARAKELKNRQALIDYQRDPKASLKYIQDELGLRFDHQRETAEASSDAPTRLDPELISIPVLTKRALKHRKDLAGFEDAGLDVLADATLNEHRRRLLLQRLRRPDYPGLVNLVVLDLQTKGSRGFGSMPIHEAMLLDQLAACAERMPDLLKKDAFVRIWASKLQPGNDVDLAVDAEARTAYLDRLWSFVGELAPVHTSLKACVLYHRLLHDRDQGIYDEDRFLRYIQIPRRATYARREYLERPANRHAQADLNADYRANIGLAPIGNDVPLVREFLLRLLRDAEDYSDYAPYLGDDYLKSVFAETKILNGIGDPERWAALLSPSQYRALKERVELTFVPTNPKYFAPGDPVALDLDVKNIESLIVRVFEINSCAYYREKREELDLAVNLEGLVATHEERHHYDEAPVLRVRRSFPFPMLEKRGAYVVEFIGNGKSSRALVQKGRLRFLQEPTSAGHGFTILDEQNRKLTDATIWVAGHEYEPEEDGTILVPYTAEPGKESVVIGFGDFCSHGRFNHLAETYSFTAGFYVDRESLLRGAEASIVVRPVLTLNGVPMSLELLEDVSLAIESVDHHGASARTDVPGFKLSNDQEAVHGFRVPPHISSLSVTLHARIQNVSRNEKEDLTASTSFSLNGIEMTGAIEDMHVTRMSGDYVVEFLGKNGETKGRKPVRVELKHRFFKDWVHVALRTDDDGRCILGPLDDIALFRLTSPDGHTKSWTPVRDDRATTTTIHGLADQPFAIPHMEGKGARVSLIEKARNRFVRDHSAAVSVGPSFLEVPGLPAGDYDLLVKPSGAHFTIRLTAGKAGHRHVLSSTRALRVRNARPLQIKGITSAGDKVAIALANATPRTRVHVFATRYRPDYSVLGSLYFTGVPDATFKHLAPPSTLYASQRGIGGEYRYILDRQYARKFPGVMLERPGLLLNPWSLRKTTAEVQEAELGESIRSQLAAAPPESAAGRQALYSQGGEALNYANLDFLAQPSAVLLNLRPDENGLVVLEREQLGDKPQLQVLAVDPQNSVFREANLAEAPLATRDLRMARGLDPDIHYAQQKLIESVPTGETFEVEDVRTSSFEVYDSLEDVFALFATLSGDTTLEEFRFVLKWPDMSAEERAKQYAKYACHELNLFLYHKDQEFFQNVIQPYLRNKKDKTFIDHWLLDENLTGYLESWAYHRLNAVERALLARRFGDARQGIRRQVAEEFDLLPPDVETFNRLFDTALKGSALEAPGGGGDLGALFDDFAPAEEMADMENEFGFGGLASAEQATRRGGRAKARRVDRQVKAKLAEPVAMAALASRVTDDLSFGDRKEARKRQRQFFQSLDKTEEWAENNYYHRPIEEQTDSLVPVNAFWKDYAMQQEEGPFLSVNVPYAAGSFAEMMLALAVLDLPFVAGEHDMSREGSALRLNAAGPMVVFHKEIRPGEPKEDKAAVLVTQNFFRADDRFGFDGNERYDKYVTDEFLRRVVYGCQVILTNPHSSLRKLNLLMQIPQGALPVQQGFYTEGRPIRLDPFSTQSFEYYFYFPSSGDFPHFPVHVSDQDRPVAFALPAAMGVVDEPTTVDTTSWTHVSQEGSQEDVLSFLERNNLGRLELARIAFRAKDREFFKRVTGLVRDRHGFDGVLWSYGLFHNDLDTAREFLASSSYADRCGDYIDTPLLTLDPVARHVYQHLEYSPLVNARAHTLGRRRQILNDRLYDQYHAFLKVLSYREGLTDEDWLDSTYYLLLQDRVEEGLDTVGRVKPEALPTQLQFDYLKTCLAFYTGDFDAARATASAYADHPVPRWRDRFVNALAHLDEVQGHEARVADTEDREQVQDQLAATEPGLEFSVEGGDLLIEYQNLETCQVNFYPMDIELLFSRNPFVRQQSAQFSFVRPAETVSLALDPKEEKKALPLPEGFRNRNVMIEITADGLRKAQAHYANALTVQVIENYGQVRVLHRQSARPQSGVYVKVYARMQDGDVRFYKDGYTDLRGRFDYVSLSTDELERVEQFALLVLSEDDGAVVKEAAPPKR